MFCRLLLPGGRLARLQVEGLAVNRVLISLDVLLADVSAAVNRVLISFDGYLADVSAADGAFW